MTVSEKFAEENFRELVKALAEGCTVDIAREGVPPVRLLGRRIDPSNSREKYDPEISVVENFDGFKRPADVWQLEKREDRLSWLD